ncbi:flavodoxin domain-containing protein [Streptomyces sp. NPDC058086]|uniref:flavodoxin domain-containing protein n=1 Tax=Streptomyces sp. NPDC058086 TaxID=3346334 RepID=UPI0036F12A6D
MSQKRCLPRLRGPTGLRRRGVGRRHTEIAPLDAYVGALPVGPPLIVTAASCNGQLTDDAAAFVRRLETAEPDTADGVTYAVLGIGDRNWAASYQHIPTLIDRRLAELGGTRLLERAEGDASGDLAGAVRQFTDRMCTALLKCAGGLGVRRGGCRCRGELRISRDRGDRRPAGRLGRPPRRDRAERH